MARPNKYNLHYFPLDVDFFEDHKILSIEEDYGVKGGYIAIRIMAMVYKDNGYYLEWPDKFEYTAAKRVGNGYTGAFVGDVLKSCLKHKLFDRSLFDRYGIITSRGIQKRWLEVMGQMRRKISITPEYWLVSSEETSISSEEKRVNDEKNAPSATFSTQKERKLNESKQNEIKEPNGVAPAKPPPQKKIFKKGEQPEPHWEQLVKVWFDFNKEKFKVEPSFKDRDPVFFKKIVQQLKKRAEQKNVEWSETIAIERMRKFLDYALKDGWLKDHFLLENLLKQFDIIIQPKKKVIASQGAARPPIVQSLMKIQKDINYCYERFLEGASILDIMYTQDFDFLTKNGMKLNDQQVNAMQLALNKHIVDNQIENKSETIDKLQKKFSIIEHFKFLKSQGHVTVFRME